MHINVPLNFINYIMAINFFSIKYILNISLH